MTTTTPPRDPAPAAKSAGQGALEELQLLRRSEAQHHRETMALLQAIADKFARAGR